MSPESEAQFSLTSPEAGEASDLANSEKVRQVGKEATRVAGSIPTFQADDFLESLLPPAQAAEYFGCSETGLRKAIAEKRILAVEDAKGAEQVPAFQMQFDLDQIGAVMLATREHLEPVCAGPKTIWLWFLSPKDELGGKTPVRWMAQNGASEPLLLAAKRDAARLAAG